MAHHSPQQVSQVTLSAAASDHPAGAQSIRGAARRRLSHSAKPQLLRLRARDALAHLYRPGHVRAALTPDRLTWTERSSWSTFPRFSPLFETFFTDRLLRQKRASPHTIASYRDTFSLLLRFTQQRLGKAPSALALDDLDAPLISAFLDDLEHTRGTSARSRNVRLAA